MWFLRSGVSWTLLEVCLPAGIRNLANIASKCFIFQQETRPTATSNICNWLSRKERGNSFGSTVLLLNLDQTQEKAAEWCLNSASVKVKCKCSAHLKMNDFSNGLHESLNAAPDSQRKERRAPENVLQCILCLTIYLGILCLTLHIRQKRLALEKLLLYLKKWLLLLGSFEIFTVIIFFDFILR